MNQTVYLGAAELLILSFALGVGVLLLVRRFSLPARIASLRTGSMGTISSWISVTKIVSVGIGPLAILLLFVGLSSGPIAEWPQQIKSRTEQKAVLPATSLSKPLDSNPQGQSSESTDRPQWTKILNSSNGDVQMLGLTSRLWSSEQEANLELEQKVISLLWEDFQTRHHQRLDPKTPGFLQTAETVKTAVRNRYSETSTHDFGSFSAPMTQVWWQVELSPAVRTELYGAWQTVLVKNRIRALGLAIAFFILLTKSISLACQLRAYRWPFYQATSSVLASFAIWATMMFWMTNRLIG